MLDPNPLVRELMNYNFPPPPSVTGLPQPITLRSLGGFFYALGWAWTLLVSFTGWGRASGKLLRVKGLPASVACVLGIATIIFLGGLLNLAHAIYPAVLFALVAAGLALYALFYKERPKAYRWSDFWSKAPRWSRLLVVVALLVVALKVAGTVRLSKFNVNDDSAAYLVFPQKMLAVHQFASDPFSDRRTISSLGGSYFLQTFVIVGTSLANIAMADRTLGLFLLAVALFDLGIVFGLSAFQIALMEFLAYLAPQETWNLTFVILPISMLLGMVWFILRTTEESEDKQSRHAMVAGAIGGATIALKSTYLPMVGALALIPYLFLFWQTKKAKAIVLPLLAGLGSLAVLAAWMVAMKQADNTYLFPVLGHGLDYSSYGLFRSMPRFFTIRSVIKIFLQAIALLILAGIQLVAGIKEKHPRLGFAVLFASVLAITAFNYESGGDFVWRYNFPQFFCAILVFYLSTASMALAKRSSSNVRFAYYAGILSLFCMVFYYDAAGKNPRPLRQVAMETPDYLGSLRAGLSGRSLEDPSLEHEYGLAEASIPSHGTALVDVAYPFLFDFQLRPILLMDWPGAASPQPGWPYGSNSVALAAYLRKNSVRYVIDGYRYTALYDAGACSALARRNLYSTELYILLWMTVLSDNQLNNFRSNFSSIYDDGKIAVIDLDAPIPNAPPEGPVWTLDSDKMQVCSIVTARYLASLPPRKTE
ncbi:MAG: hypothetical protein ACP5EP_11350 [Acidobacteriaceae bacterium]